MAWNSHTRVYTATEENGRDPAFDGFSFVGPLQPDDFTGGAGNDSYTTTLAGEIVDGKGGTDFLTFSRPGAVANFTWSFTPGGTSTASDGTKVISFEFIEITTGSGNDTVTFNNPLLTANPFSTVNNFNGGLGNDRAVLNYS